MTAGPPGPEPLPPRPLLPIELPRRIVLTGFMGAGKSTIGPLLASRLGWCFLDVDTIIAAQQGLSVAEIFAQQGESAFRRLEAEAIAVALSDTDDPDHHSVIALGGGAVETPAVRALLFNAGAITADASSIHVPATVTIFLEAPLSELLARCQAVSETPIRPLLAPTAEAPAERLRRRLPYYNLAHLTVSTSATPPSIVVDSILTWLAGAWPDKFSRRASR